MKKIIDGKTYNTDTATHLADIGNSLSRGDLKQDHTGLYRTSKGAFFIAGRGGPMSRWSRRTGPNEWSGGSGIEAISPDEARVLLEKHGDVETYERVFGIAEAA